MLNLAQPTIYVNKHYCYRPFVHALRKLDIVFILQGNWRTDFVYAHYIVPCIVQCMLPSAIAA